MKIQFGILHKILLMVAVTGLVIGAVIISAGVSDIYRATESGIESEISMAAKTMNNLYKTLYTGDLSYDGEVCSIGGRVFSDDDFTTMTSCIGCENDVDFTLFYGDTRLFTSVRNSDETLAVGTKAAPDVVESVLNSGMDYVSSRVLVNEKYYMGYYIPIKAESGVVAGMLFAGKPLESAEKNAVTAVLRFIVLAVFTLLVSTLLCIMLIRRVVLDIDNIKGYLGRLAQGDFSTRLDSATLARTDEIGELAQYSECVMENLRDMVERDPLTMLYNRRTCHKRLDELRSQNTGFAVVMGDIDYFKKINDTYGHSAGDEVLKTVSGMLRQCAVSRGGFAVRWGGEEFLMIFPGLSVEEAHPLATGLLNGIRTEVIRHDGREITVTMTLGIAASQNGSEPEKTINAADELLYYGKNHGRNQIVTKLPEKA
ncbi:MAG: diguanylate cyclase domain-containing protein [Oscillospiraceae bacterium]